MKEIIEKEGGVMETVTYEYLEKAHEELLELRLMGLNNDNALSKCCEALYNVREAIVFERTGKPLNQYLM